MPKQQKTKSELCTGGRSFNCRRENHDRKRDVYCYRCNARMGCIGCVESNKERICLECHNWAHRRGVQYHGNVVPNIKQPRVRTDSGWIQHHPLTDDVNKLIGVDRPA